MLEGILLILVEVVVFGGLFLENEYFVWHNQVVDSRKDMGFESILNTLFLFLKFLSV